MPKGTRRITSAAGGVATVAALVVALGLGSSDATPQNHGPESRDQINSDIATGKATLLTTETAAFGLWYNCQFVTVPQPSRHYALPDGGEAVIADAPDMSGLPPRDPACDNVPPTQAQIDGARARAMSNVPPGAKPGGATP